MCGVLKGDLAAALGRCSSRVLRLGTDCSGAEAPYWALQEIAGELQKSIAATVKVDHVFACEVANVPRRFIMENTAPRALFSDLLARGTIAHCLLAERPRLVPGDLDIYVAGFPCKDFSALNKDRPGLQGPHASCFWGVVEYIRRHEPRAFVLENVDGLTKSKSGNEADIFKVMSVLRSIPHYQVRGWKVNTRNFYLPQTRRRVYIVGVHTKKASLRRPLQTWAPLISALEHSPTSEAAEFLLGDEEPEVVAERTHYSAARGGAGFNGLASISHEQLQRQRQQVQAWLAEGKRGHAPGTVGCASHKDPVGLRWVRTNVLARAQLGLPIDSADTDPRQGDGEEDHHDSWIGFLSTRVAEIIRILGERISVTNHGVAAHETSAIAEVSQSIGFASIQWGISPCVTPSARLWVFKRRRWILGVEELALQGFPVDRLDLRSFNDSNLASLAGNAMSVPVVGAFLLLVLALVEFPGRDGGHSFEELGAGAAAGSTPQESEQPAPPSRPSSAGEPEQEPMAMEELSEAAPEERMDQTAENMMEELRSTAGGPAQLDAAGAQTSPEADSGAHDPFQPPCGADDTSGTPPAAGHLEGPGGGEEAPAGEDGLTARSPGRAEAAGDGVEAAEAAPPRAEAEAEPSLEADAGVAGDAAEAKADEAAADAVVAETDAAGAGAGLTEARDGAEAAAAAESQAPAEPAAAAETQAPLVPEAVAAAEPAAAAEAEAAAEPVAAAAATAEAAPAAAAAPAEEAPAEAEADAAGAEAAGAEAAQPELDAAGDMAEDVAMSPSQGAAEAEVAGADGAEAVAGEASSSSAAPLGDLGEEEDEAGVVAFGGAASPPESLRSWEDEVLDDMEATAGESTAGEEPARAQEPAPEAPGGRRSARIAAQRARQAAQAAAASGSSSSSSDSEWNGGRRQHRRGRKVPRALPVPRRLAWTDWPKAPDPLGAIPFELLSPTSDARLDCWGCGQSSAVHEEVADIYTRSHKPRFFCRFLGRACAGDPTAVAGKSAACVLRRRPGAPKGPAGKRRRGGRPPDGGDAEATTPSEAEAVLLSE